MFRETLIWIVLFIFSVINTFSIVVGNGELLNIPLWSSWLFLLGITIVITTIFLFRKFLQKKYSSYSLVDESKLNLKENEYFFQSPLYIVDNQVIPIYGEGNITYTPTYFNKLHKLISLFGFMPIYSTYLSSDKNEIKIIPRNAFSLRYKYNVYLNNDFVGIYEMKRLIKDKGIKQQLPYTFRSEDDEYSLHNAYMSTKTTITNNNDAVLFQADRSVFDFSKEQNTKKRGEKHHIKIDVAHESSELLLALYIQAIINKQSQKAS